MRAWTGTTAAAAIVIAGLFGAHGAAQSDPLIERGRYLVGFGSCNDCHTAGWLESDGTIPVSRWMTGSNLGYRGPWGTSYPANVRLEFQAHFGSRLALHGAQRGGHWPMVWHDLRFLKAEAQRAIYRFIKYLGPSGVERRRICRLMPRRRRPTSGSCRIEGDRVRAKLALTSSATARTE